MARGVNKVILLGNVGKDPEIRATASGSIVASFSLATADRAKDAQGNWVDKAEWHNLVAFQKTAEIVRDYVKKGSLIYIEGKITNRSWDDKDGQKRYKTEILVSDLTFVGTKQGSGESSSGGYSKSSTASYDQRPPAAQPEYADQGITDDDIPF